MKITAPTLLLNESICKANIHKMSEMAKHNHLLFRPHFKTHQSAQVGEWFREEGVEAITVSSLKMAQYFAANGWKDITIAFSVYPQQCEAINELASIINLQIVIESTDMLTFFENHLTHPVGVFLKIDAGYHRTGIDGEDFDTIASLLNQLKTCRNLIFIGFLTHAGHTYKAKSIDEIGDIKAESIRSLFALKTFFKADFPLLQLSYGDTPSCSLFDSFLGMNELRPGNFVFYDLTQCQIGSCQRENIAVALASPVVAKHEKRNEIVVHGGAVHLSKDSLVVDGRPIYGEAYRLTADGWDLKQPVGTVISLSQEHGIIEVSAEILKEINVGDVIAILPVHSCLTASCMRQMVTLTGETIEMMP